MKTREHARRRAAASVAALALCAVLGACDAPTPKAAASAAPARTVTWDDLVPTGWDPSKQFRQQGAGPVAEGSAAEQAMMRELREVWDSAPTRSDLDGARIRLPGYVVPLDTVAAGQVTQFLLVPYFGACIHSPPPPANQIVHVTLKSPAAWRTMDAVWVSGTLSTRRQDSSMGVSGYALAAERVEAYEASTPSSGEETPRGR